MSSRRNFFQSGVQGIPFINNLLAYYPLVSNSNDVIGGNNGTDISVTYGSGGGDFQDMANFSVSGAKITLPTGTYLSLSNGTSDFNHTIGFRLKFANTSTASKIILDKNNSTSDREYLLRMVTGGITLRMQYYDQSVSSTPQTVSANDASFPSTSLVYFILVRKNGTAHFVDIYQGDGTFIASSGNTLLGGGYVCMEPVSSPVIIGSSWDGWIGDLWFADKYIEGTDLDYVINRYSNNLPLG